MIRWMTGVRFQAKKCLIKSGYDDNKIMNDLTMTLINVVSAPRHQPRGILCEAGTGGYKLVCRQLSLTSGWRERHHQPNTKHKEEGEGGGVGVVVVGEGGDGGRDGDNGVAEGKGVGSGGGEDSG
ncbi:hypothetical protein Pcinc_037402 [Petrolisthes cinctipes]|uniref:Uncharacterized protein n=1 Tax=Petrolisthes cinctipes TaxID=88211 RepID=A0AAE1BSL6_PETCI|nr:hypothetical protein Pcinc_037402 [Petrolisthes cinctipes]